jgi:Ca-activated chloride channel family protein
VLAPHASVRAEPLALTAGDKTARYTIRVSVRLVVLPISVTDRKENEVPGLQAGNFRVYDNGHLQKIVLFKHEDIPVTVGLVLDNSMSMMPKRKAVEDALLTFARSSNPNDQMFVVNFSDTASVCPAGNVLFTDQPALLRKCVGVAPGGRTALYDALALALRHLDGGTRPKKSLIVVSDGGDNASHCSLREALHMAENSSAVIYTVGLLDPNEADQNPGVLRRLAKVTGGVPYFPNTPAEVDNILQKVARDLREQYIVGYVPPTPGKTGRYHKLRVRVVAAGMGKLLVRTRTGYYMPTPSPPS